MTAQILPFRHPRKAKCHSCGKPILARTRQNAEHKVYCSINCLKNSEPKRFLKSIGGGSGYA